MVAQALKTYGMILADNGSPWYISGRPEPALEQRRAPRTRRAHRPRLPGREHQLAPAPRTLIRDPARPGGWISASAGLSAMWSANPSGAAARPPSSGSVQITERDRILLSFAAEHRFVLAAQIAVSWR